MNLGKHISYQTLCKIAVKARRKDQFHVTFFSDDELLLLIFSLLVESKLLAWILRMNKGSSAPYISLS